MALTSCSCKSFERLINDRLIDYLEMTKALSPIQCECRKNRSTTDHLVRTEQSTRTAFATKEHLVSIFFGLEKAYDMTWRYGILEDLFSMGLRGLLPRCIAAFLHGRQFRVRVADHLSDIQPQVYCVPQGSVLSVTLFAINSITNHIPSTFRFLSSLFVDGSSQVINVCK